MQCKVWKYLPAILVLFSAVSALGQNKDSVKHDLSDSLYIEKIEISRNWMTWDRIIKKELLFDEGQWVTYGALDTSIAKVWNIGNFADVDYNVKPSDGGNILELTALDAVAFYPLITIDHSSENDYNYRLGFGDENFLGTNMLLKIVWDKKPTGAAWDFSLKIPRQLLYENMTARFGYNTGTGTNRFLERVITDVDGQKTASYKALMLAPYNKTEVYVEIGNPWHLDYTYRFSPNLALRYMNHQINHDLLSEEELNYGVQVPEEKYRFMQMTLSENIGIINAKRHRMDGYSANLGYTLNLGLNDTESFHTFSLEGEYHKILNQYVQLSTWAKTGYTTADNQYQFIKGSSDVKGLRTGEIFGQTYYSAYAGTHFTWLNTKWLSLEHAVFANWGNGAPDFSQLFSDTKLSLGTSLEIKVPMVSFIEFRFTFMYAGPGSEWFKFNM